MGKFTFGAVKVTLFLEPRHSVVVTALTYDGSGLVQASRRLVATGSLWKRPDFSQLHSLAAAHSASLEIVTTPPSAALAERVEGPGRDDAKWIEASLRTTRRELDASKRDYEEWKGVRDLDIAENHLRNRREEIQDLEQKLIANAREPDLIYSPGRWVQSAWQLTDRVRFREEKDRAEQRASALRTRIDFTRRTRIRELEEKERDLTKELAEERKAEQSRTTRIQSRLDEGVATFLVLTIRSSPILVTGRKGPAVRAALDDVIQQSEKLRSRARDKLGLALDAAGDLSALGSALTCDIATLRALDGEVPQRILAEIEKSQLLLDRGRVEDDTAKVATGLLTGTRPAATLPSIDRFPSPRGPSKRLAYLGLALKHDLSETPVPLLFDIDEQGPRHIAVVGGSGSGKSVAASLIVEAAADHDVPVLIFDPTRSWTGLAMPCIQSALLECYARFRMKPEWARGYPIRIIDPGSEPLLPIATPDLLNFAGITILASRTLSEDQENALAASLLKRLYETIRDWSESTKLRCLIVLEEAHRYLKDKRIEPILELFARTARAKGVGLLVVSQVAVDLPPAVRTNCATKIQLHSAYAHDLQRAAQTFGSDYQKIIPRLTRGQGVVHFPEYGSALVAFRPPLHNPHSISEGVARFYTITRDLDRIVASLLRQTAPRATDGAAQTQTPKQEPAEAPRALAPLDWRATAQEMAQTRASSRSIHAAIAATGAAPPLRTLQRFLKAQRAA